jgi:biotin synthase-related radical SAM superfamily protein
MTIEDFKIKYPILWQKVDILCHGIREDTDGILAHIYSAQNPADTQRTGNNGVQLKLDNRTLALNVAVYKDFCKKSPYMFIKNNSKKLFLRNSIDETLIDIYCPECTPVWYGTDAGNNNVIGNYIVLEGDFTAIASITKGCVYFNKSINKPCAFCAIGEDSDTKLYQEALLKALPVVVSDENITHILLTGGNTFSSDRGALNYIKFIEEIQRHNKSKHIAVEIPPPEIKVQHDIFAKLKDAGTDSITINIEFWDDAIREKLMPIKGRFTKTEYISAYQEALKFFGNNKVICGFIIGIEPKEQTVRGMMELSKIGIISEVYPFKPNKGSLMEKYQITPTDFFIEISIEASRLMRENGIDPSKCSGCVKCGACGITQQLFEYNIY